MASGMGDHMRYWLGRAIFMGGLPFGGDQLSARLGKDAWERGSVDYGDWPGYTPPMIFWSNFSDAIEVTTGVVSMSYNGIIEWPRATGDYGDPVTSFAICTTNSLYTEQFMGGNLATSIPALLENQQIYMPSGNFTATFSFS